MSEIFISICVYLCVCMCVCVCEYLHFWYPLHFLLLLFPVGGEPFPEVLFLGTGSAEPNKVRNVSGIWVNVR